MLGEYQSNHQNNIIAYQLFADWLNPSTGRRSRSHSSVHPHSRNPNGKSNKGGSSENDKRIQNDSQIAEEFYRTFMFGLSMSIWRKGRVKKVEVFIDPYLSSLLWISSKTKAFLFDLTYTTVERVDLELEKSSNMKQYIVLHYFE